MSFVHSEVKNSFDLKPMKQWDHLISGRVWIDIRAYLKNVTSPKKGDAA